MASLIPIPTTRVGDYFIRQRLVRQVQGDQLGLFQLQNQVSTGRRIIRPSDDAPAALRAIALQRTIHRKEQAERNLAGSRSVLGSADSALNSVNDVLNQVRGAAIEAVGNLTSDSARQAAISTIDKALSSLVTSGNSNYNGRYLFAGSRTNVAPFEQLDQFVQYNGNEKSLQNYVDLEQLFTTNLPGTEVFGGISGEVRGTADFNPELTLDTLLTSINGGEGIDTNSAISVGVNNGLTTTSSIIDLSGAVTIGDVIRRIEAGTSGVTVNIANNGLTLSTDPGSTIRVSEVAAGRAAKELGIFTPTAAVATPSVIGSDLDPVAEKTTLLANLFGTKASVRLDSAGSNNELVITAAANGVALNGVTVTLADGGTAGNEGVSYAAGTLTVQIESGVSTAAQVVDAINLAQSLGTIPFTAAIGRRDATSSTAAGTGAVVAPASSAVTAGGSGEALDTASGLVLTNGGETVTLDISTAETLEDLFNLISGAQIGLAAAVNAEGNGINVRSLLSGADFTIGENGGTTAKQLGIRTFNGSTQLADLNRGVGVPTSDTLGVFDASQLDSLEIVARDGTTISVDLTGATTLRDVVDLINNDTENNTGTTAVTASLTSLGRGIQLADSSTGTGPLTIQAPPGTTAAAYLGFLHGDETQTSTTSQDSVGNTVFAGSDVVLNDLSITASDDSQFWVDLTGTATVQDVIDRINAAATDANVTLTAQIAATGNGVTLIDSTGGADTLAVATAEGSEAAEFLGFLPNAPVETDGFGNQLLTSEDRHTQEVDSVYNTLVRLRQALEDSDSVAIGRAVERLDVDLERATFARGEIGSRLQTLDVVETRLEDENVQLQLALSNEIDVDLIEAISNLTARQYALQASLQTAASILNLSILDYI